jgi:hypothetical protein
MRKVQLQTLWQSQGTTHVALKWFAEVMQVRADASSACGYRVSLEPLHGQPSWCWVYELLESGSIRLRLKEAALVSAGCLLSDTAL